MMHFRAERMAILVTCTAFRLTRNGETQTKLLAQPPPLLVSEDHSTLLVAQVFYQLDTIRLLQSSRDALIYMSFHRVARAGVLRHLHLGNGLGRSTNVIGVQQQLRQLSLTTRPRMTIPSVGALPTIGSQRLRAFATEDGPANEDKPAKKKTAAKKKSTKSKSKKKTTSKPKPKKKKPLTEKGQERKKRSEQRAKINELKATALTEPKKLPTVWRHVAIQSKFAELNIPAGTGVEKLRFVNEAVKSLSPEEIEVCLASRQPPNTG